MQCGHQIDHFSIGTQKHPYDLSLYPQEIKELVNIDGENIVTDLSAVDAFIHLFKKGSYNVDRFSDKKIKKSIEKYLIENNPDIVIFDSLYSTPYIEVVKNSSEARLLLRSHNVEADIWTDLAEESKNTVKRAYLKKLAKDLGDYELAAMSKMDDILCISQNDIDRFKDLSVDAPLHYIPVNLAVSEKTPDYNNTDILHIGSLKWEPNQQSLRKLIGWLPMLKSAYANVKIKVIGNGLDGSFEAVAPDCIEEIGYVENLQQYLMKGGILVTLIDSGSGIRIKILEMMAAGLPVVSNTKGAVGIDCEAVRIADNSDAFVEAVVELLENKELRQSIGQLSRDFIGANHNADKICEKLNGIIQPR